VAVLQGRWPLVAVLAAFLVVPPVLDGFFLDGLRVVGYSVCHQLPDHSFTFAGQQLPLCARCSGIYIGFLIGLLGMALLGKLSASLLPPRAVTLVLLLALVSMGADGFNSLLAFAQNAPPLYQPTNLLRLSTGMAAGVAMALLLVPLLNDALWAKPDRSDSVSDLGELLGYGVLASLGTMAVYSEQPILLYPIAVLSSLGVFATLGTAGTALAATLLRRERRAARFGETSAIFAVGLVLAVVSMAAFGGAKAYFSLVAGL
jgi:uncharacterized membrane protein